MPGVVKVVIDLKNGFAGVVAESREQAYAAVAALDLEWDPGHLWQQAEVEAGGHGRRRGRRRDPERGDRARPAAQRRRGRGRVSRADGLSRPFRAHDRRGRRQGRTPPASTPRPRRP